MNYVALSAIASVLIVLWSLGSIFLSWIEYREDHRSDDQPSDLETEPQTLHGAGITPTG